MAHPARAITVTLDINKAFDTINIHTLIRKRLLANILGTFIIFIANYIKDENPTEHTETKLQFLSPTLYNIYTANLPPPRAWV